MSSRYDDTRDASSKNQNRVVIALALAAIAAVILSGMYIGGGFAWIGQKAGISSPDYAATSATSLPQASQPLSTATASSDNVNATSEPESIDPEPTETAPAAPPAQETPTEATTAKAAPPAPSESAATLEPSADPATDSFVEEQPAETNDFSDLQLEDPPLDVVTVPDDEGAASSQSVTVIPWEHLESICRQGDGNVVIPPGATELTNVYCDGGGTPVAFDPAALYDECPEGTIVVLDAKVLCRIQN